MTEQLWRIRVFGIVQGVGFRPTVSRHADACHIHGNVSNVGPYVEIWAKGLEEDLRHFIEKIEYEPPRRAAILKLTVEEKDPGRFSFSDFSIVESEKRQGDIFVSPDIAICPECKKELYDPADRRYLHPFINCTCCGPRLTILDGMPYDRIRTSMKDFPMCPECEFEYTHASTRRYDAQPVCCNDCGPEVYLLDREERGPEAIRAARQMIKDGGIVGIKGIGGFHLCCDAASEQAVSLLRKRKKRPVKPFAVMMKDKDVVRRECDLSFCPPDLMEILDGHQKPILLLPKSERGSLAASVAPGNPRVGVMLPYAPIHLLLFDYQDELKLPDCLVMTSANTSGAPICRDDEDARRELSGLCDLILSHNRLIRLRADDTVMDIFEGRPYMIRRSRGYAPLPVMTSEELTGQVLAIGGELKNTFCIGKNQLYYPSPYIGDMEDARTVRALKESVKRMQELLEASPSIVACDLHPGYNTTAVARELAGAGGRDDPGDLEDLGNPDKPGLTLYPVQHHYAHILSCMAENDYSGQVIGVSFDGTGYGTDGTIWGGEFLLADYEGFKRPGSIRPFLHVGGDTASRQGWRIAVSLIYSLYGREKGSRIIDRLKVCDGKTAGVLMTMAARRINTVKSTSAGRIFDAVSAILGICRENSYEGEASTFLQFAAERYEARMSVLDKGKDIVDCFSVNIRKESGLSGEQTGFEWIDTDLPGEGESCFQLKTDDLVKYIIEKTLEGADAEEMAYEFHSMLASAIVQGCIYLRNQAKLNTVALSGGVWQNQLLLRLTTGLLKQAGFQVLTHQLIPPNDGGICLGQAAAAMHYINRKNCTAVNGTDK
ncbi:MAG: carbamoyltransferase HypF [Eubacterium sp.]|nr:carbamoyltransferase HypF [Eubacterium sp.]